MTYRHFAYLYDHLMQDVPYDQWQRIVVEQIQSRHLQGIKVLDVACGTGEISIRLAKVGLDVTGVDLSEDMLAVANNKASHEGLTIPFYQQNMTELEFSDSYDVVILFCDSLNYLRSEVDVQNTFASIYNLLSSDGLFLFDVHSIHKMKSIFKDQTFTYEDETHAYIWNCFEGEHPYSVEHELTFFVQEEHSSLYQRYEEFHQQRTFHVDTYLSWLDEAGFEVLETFADFNQPIEAESERIFFVAKQKKTQG